MQLPRYRDTGKETIVTSVPIRNVFTRPRCMSGGAVYMKGDCLSTYEISPLWSGLQIVNMSGS